MGFGMDGVPRRWTWSVAGGLVALLVAGSVASGEWLLTGTAVTGDQVTGVPGVKVTIHPDSITVITDDLGDFLVPWSGRKGWLAFVPPERSRDGTEWCKRVTLKEALPAPADSMLDVGPLVIAARLRLPIPTRPVRPAEMGLPDTLLAPGPGPDDPLKVWALVNYEVDLWGSLKSAEWIDGTRPPDGLMEAIRDWLESVPWTVRAETDCKEEHPFVGSEPFPYVWRDGAWLRDDVLTPERGGVSGDPRRNPR